MIAWTVAGSDSGGGAGIQADLKAFQGLGVHGCSVVTALTAQNTQKVIRAETVKPAMVAQQIQALISDLPPAAIKTGMLGSAEIISVTAKALKDLNCPVVCDPVMVATSGDSLIDQAAVRVMVEALFPLCRLVTPNLPEAEVLSGKRIENHDDILQAAQIILGMGPESVLIKGGHGSGSHVQDYWTDGKRGFWLTNSRLAVENSHGSGCTLSAAVTAALALGYPLEDALVIGSAYVHRGIRTGKGVGQGATPVSHGPWPQDFADLPWITAEARPGRNRPQFPSCGPEPLGFYPIVDRASWLERILPLGVKTVQLRIKDLAGEALEGEIQRGIDLCNHFGTRLFVNDYWQLAIKLGAYGVHLGQEDLVDADLTEIANHGLRLGVSTHSYGEVARAHGVRPSYMAIGPIYATTTKTMAFAPQGLDALARWRTLLDYPLVAIGGISLDRAENVLGRGADSIAVVSAVTADSNPESAVTTWLKLFDKRAPMD